MRKGRKCPKCGYDRNDGDAAWCGLCYEPFQRPGAAPEAAPPSPAAAPAAGPAGFKPLVFLVSALLGGLLAAGVFFLRGGHTGGAAAEAPGQFAPLTARADQLLKEHTAQQAAFLAEITADGTDPEGFGLEGRYTKKLFRLEDEYANAINALKLPCPSCVDKERDALYLRWTAEHQAREAEAMKEFNGRYTALAMKAVAGR
ncbi:MAG: hypothetical protein NDI60_02950 [Elusimicrobiales bacterium]|nr:hypothetical protein [Elusimicrobiales bacterium]